jgi:hypothetical protein
MTKAQLSLNKDMYIFENVTYKPNCAVPMIDKSPKLEVARALAKAGKAVKIRDRFAVILEVMKEYGDLFQYETISDVDAADYTFTGVY